MHSIAYHAYRGLAARRCVTPSRAPANGGPPAPSPEALPDEIVAHADLAAAVYGSVDELEPDLRHTVQLHYYQDLTLQETADAMGVATSTVKYRLRQALAELQRKLTRSRSSLASTATPKMI